MPEKVIGIGDAEASATDAVFGLPRCPCDKRGVGDDGLIEGDFIGVSVLAAAEYNIVHHRREPIVLSANDNLVVISDVKERVEFHQPEANVALVDGESATDGERRLRRVHTVNNHARLGKLDFGIECLALFDLDKLHSPARLGIGLPLCSDRAYH